MALRYLVSVAELGSLTAAAEEHRVTQPAISISLRKLAAGLGVSLVEADGRRVRFTRAGEIVLDYARRFARLEEELLREMADLEGLVRGKIAIGTIDAASAYVLPHVFSRFRERYPGIDISLEVMATSPLLTALRAGRLDLVVGTLPVEGDTDLEVFPIYTEHLLLVAHPGHPLARVRALSSAALAQYPFISFHEGATTRRIIENALAAHGVAPRVTMTTDSPEAIRNLAAAGLGMATLPEMVVRDDIERGVLVELSVKGLTFERTLGLIIPSRRYLSATVRAFLAVLADGLGIELPRRFLPGGAESVGRSPRPGTSSKSGKGRRP
ncbi:MAG: LysR family transcriptional regulator [Candidatus Krumholzibacteria bacterium]|nr:LysR family transcriptional regulator [Candidatus Krumholzibacteria bacterium]